MSRSEKLLRDALAVLDHEKSTLREHLPFRDIALKILRNAIESRGSKGVEEAEEILTKLLDGKHVPLSTLTEDLWLASDLLAVLQTMEASTKKVVRDWIVLIAQEVLGILRRL